VLVYAQGDGTALVITQPSHAWLSGQLARAWGNERFGTVTPREAACLAAEQHDLGWTERDLLPLLDPETGWPRSFMAMPLPVHLALWSAAPARMLAQSRYAALLVSAHGHALYARRDLEAAPPGEAEAIQRFLHEQEAVQDDLLRSLRADPALAPHTASEAVRRNQRLLWTWDGLSLALLLGWAPHAQTHVPAASGEEDLQLEEVGPRRFTVSPWPFAVEELAVSCEGRLLAERAADEEELRAALERAPWVTLRLTLVAPDGG
jgi:hypothetical protein